MYMYHVCTIVCREHDDECYQVCGKLCHNWEKCLDKNIKILLTNIRIKKLYQTYKNHISFIVS